MPALPTFPMSTRKPTVIIQTVNDIANFHDIGSIETDLSSEQIKDLWEVWRDEFPLSATGENDSAFVDWLVQNHGAIPVQASVTVIDIG